MMNGSRILAIIPARGGSKGVPLKNIRNFAGKPLLAWSIEAAHRCKSIDRVILSSDHKEIMEVAVRYGCDVPFIRPQALANDQAASIDVALHALETLEEEYHCLIWLQPTSPLRTTEDIQAALELLIFEKNSSCTSVSQAPKPPEWMFRLNDDSTLRPVLDDPRSASNRQTLSPVYVLNGAIYACSIPWLIQGRKFVDSQTKAYIMDPKRSIDIDTELDFKLGELFIQERMK
ncbi:MAG: CMP-N-acetylneuraminic acid synthetase [Magnetococcales bacterium]|nr:CMP-N-acetylneuraminic acid synthetase [Magnetococcales bacterium]HIJ84723.1 acylneuraminate cytidylyltransferase family protein [Magnetococcales bacterium]